MGDDPLTRALEDIAPKLDPDVKAVVTSLLRGESAEEAWEDLLQEVLRET